MSNNIKKPRIVEFALHEPRPAQWSFRNYFDEDYNDVSLVQSKQHGVVKSAYIKFPPNTRIIRIPLGKKDIEGKSFVDFIRNSPFCKGSPLCPVDANGNDRSMFYEINPIKDAKVKLEEDRLRVRATSYALEVEGDKLVQLANFRGCFHEDEDVQRSVVMEFAKLNPREFNEAAESPSIAYSSLFHKAVNKGIIQRKGFLCEAVFDDSTIALGNEKTAIEKLGTDKQLFNSIKSAVENK